MAIHGSKSMHWLNDRMTPIVSDLFIRYPTAQEERDYAIKSFKSGKKDVMVASGVGSKGLDFNEVQVRLCVDGPDYYLIRAIP